VAQAAPLQLGVGVEPDAAVDEAGTAHVVWNAVDNEVADRFFYCQVPRTAKACRNTKTFNPPHEAIGRDTYVFARPGGRIVIFSHRCCGPGDGSFVFESTDGGLNFGPGRVVGTLDPQEQAIFGPGESISAAGEQDFQNSALSGGSGPGFVDFDPGFVTPTSASVGLFNDAIPVHARADGDDTTFHVYDGSGSLNDKANWAGPTAIPPGDEVRLAGGPAGLALLYQRGSSNKRYLGARVFNGTNFGDEAVVSEKASPIFGALGSSPFSAGFHALWINNRTPNELRWSRSPNGTDWNPPYVAARGKEPDNAYRLRVAGAPDGRAFAVYDQNTNDGAVKGIWLPAKGEPPTDRAAVGQYAFSFFAPFNCVPKGSPVALKVVTRTKKGVPKKKQVSLQRAAFKLGTESITDVKPAYSASFPTTDLVAGQAYKVSAAMLFRRSADGPLKFVAMTGLVSICP
jgi:hypothetical protein